MVVLFPTANRNARPLAKNENRHSVVSPDVQSTEALLPRPRGHVDFHQLGNE